MDLKTLQQFHFSIKKKNPFKESYATATFPMVKAQKAKGTIYW